MDEKYDVVIIGAGINGVATAKALAEAGKRVLVLEKSHIGAGASSHSSRLIHGGLRYLEHFEFTLVKEALSDQQYLLQNYPELVTLRPFYLPLYAGSTRPAWMIRLGLWIYSLFSRHGQAASEVSIDLFCKAFPAIRREGLKRVFRYFDAKTDDAALTHKIAHEALEKGAELIEETKIEKIDTETEKIVVHTEKGNFSTSVLINASGAWVDETNLRYALPSSYTIEKLSGIHLVIDRVLVPEPLILETSTQRIFFIIPESTTTLIGTTERSEEADIDDIRVNEEDIEYLLKESNRYLKSALGAKDIKEVFIGVRPIIKSNKDPSKMSREYKLDLHTIGNNRILNIYGGKLTTFPSLAKRVVRRLF